MQFKIILVCLCVILLGASCRVATSTNNASYNGNVNTADHSNASSEQEDIIYGTDMSPAVVEESRNDCQERGGIFDECGSACEVGEVCIAVCALRCDFR